MNKTIKLSIICPVYQSEYYIEECVDSIINSIIESPYDLTQIELILINDGSTDNSLNLCNNLKNKYSNIILINQINSGVSFTRNHGIKEAKGEYLCFIDSDDLMDISYITNIKKKIYETSFDLCFFNYKDMENDINLKNITETNRKSLFLSGNTSNNMLFDNISKQKIYLSNCWSCVFRTKFIRDNQILFNENINSSEDLDFINTCISKSSSIYFMDCISIIYRRIRDGSITNTYNNKKAYYDLIVRKKWMDYFIDKSKENSTFYANEYVDILYKADNNKLFDDILYLFVKNKYIISHSSSKKGKTLNILIKLFGCKNGLKISKFLYEKVGC